MSGVGDVRPAPDAHPRPATPRGRTGGAAQQRPGRRGHARRARGGHDDDRATFPRKCHRSPTRWRSDARLDASTGVVTAEVTQALRIEDFETLAATVDPWIRARGELPGLVLHLHGLPRWASLGSLVRHVQFVVGHQGKLGRLALVTDAPVTGTLATTADHVVHPDVRAFGDAQLTAAQAWAAGA